MIYTVSIHYPYARPRRLCLAAAVPATACANCAVTNYISVVMARAYDFDTVLALALLYKEVRQLEVLLEPLLNGHLLSDGQ